MKIVQMLAGIPVFSAKKGAHNLSEDIEIKVIPGIPFDVPEELAIARIKASPNLYREATEADFEYAKNYKEEKVQELNNIQTVPDVISAATSTPQAPSFDVNDYLLNNYPHSEEALGQLEPAQLKAIADELEIKYPVNIGKAKLIEKILEKVAE